MRYTFRILLAGLALAFASASCTIVCVDTHSGPPRIESDGIVDGHLAVGIPAEDRILHAELFDGRSPGAIAEIVVWKLFRLEVGLAGLAVGVGPLDVGLGVLAYNPRIPEFAGGARDHDHDHEEEDDDDSTIGVEDARQ